MSVLPAAPTQPAADASPRAAETCWPLAGSGEFSLLDADWRESRAAKFEIDLREHVMEPWFPRSIDTDSGGFLCDFDGNWRPRGSQARMLEFQARHTRTVARLGQAFPHDYRWTQWTEHGRRLLDEAMRDVEYGGWYWLVDHEGAAQAQGTKHAHSTAYLISAYIETYRLTGDTAALESAKVAFEWLDAALHDSEHGGYRTWATREGRPILKSADADLPTGTTDPLGHGLGLKDANVHSDLLEGLRLLYAEWPSPIVRERLLELSRILMERHGEPDGSMNYVLNDDLTPVRGPKRFGYPAQTGSRMIRIAPLIGMSLDEAFSWARRGLEHILRDGRHPRGGFLNETPPGRPFRPWWVQTEILQFMLLLVCRDGEAVLADAIDDLSVFMDDELIDHGRGGIYPRPRSDWPLRARILPAKVYKGDRWKDASHEADLYLTGVRALRGVDAGAPLREGLSSGRRIPTNV